MLSLRKNQQVAVQLTVDEDFKSGVHQHATGAGKSVIALECLKQFYARYPTHNVMWICEQKSILIDQFDRDVLRAKGYHETLKQYLVLDYSSFKLSTWTNSVNASKYWSKPALIIINRAFLTSNVHYENIRLPIHLIFHDECHSITNDTTRAFYTHMMTKHPEIKCIGFSATPVLHIQPFSRVISRYSIYDSVCDEVIVPPRIIWCKSTERITDLQYAHILKDHLQSMPYKKCIVWCGMIKHCSALATLFSTVFQREEGWYIATDTSVDSSQYEHFYERKSHALLFCAAKHREGSDIPNLDSCMFMDRVEDRSHKVFVQCIGRVLRKDHAGLKKEGLVIDAKAKSSINVCNRLNTYLNDSKSSHDIFPWKYEVKTTPTHHENTLILLPNVSKSGETGVQLLDEHMEFTFEYVMSKCKRKMPTPRDERYEVRLGEEWKLFMEKKLVHHVLQAVEILELTEHIPHVTRGSCGSSLLCYLLGISNVDPVKYDICFARFLNEYRDTLPDIDFDFPHELRDEVFLKLQIRWPGKIARISNHCYFHEKSAHREALRRMGRKGFMGKDDVPRIISMLSNAEKVTFDEIVREILDTFSHYSLHCGGIVFFPTGVPDDLLHASATNTNVLRQITCNKGEIASDKRFKVDILSSRALSQLHEMCDYGEIDFDANPCDEKTSALLCRGDNVGITLAESPLMRKALYDFQPKCMEDVSMCLAVIRPAAKDARGEKGEADVVDAVVFDDDVIKVLMDTIGCSAGDADRLRRKLSKGHVISLMKKNKKELHLFCEEMNVPEDKVTEMMTKLRNVSKYGFCKSHAYSYGQLVWQLAYMKAHHPLRFWKATLHHAQSSYKRWVHLTEAWADGYYVDPFNQSDKSVYSTSKRSKLVQMSALEQLRAFGCWDLRKYTFIEDCGMAEITSYTTKQDETKVVFRGIFACTKRLNKNKLLCCVGVGVKQYIELMCIGKNKWMKRGAIGVEGEGVVVARNPCTIMSTTFNFF